MILGLDYGVEIDTWSVGCMLVELYTGRPLFPGENEREQIILICDAISMPDQQMIDVSERGNLFFDSAGRIRSNAHSRRRRSPGSRSIAAIIDSRNAEFVDLITKTLAWRAEARIKPIEALQHPFFSQL